MSIISYSEQVLWNEYGEELGNFIQHIVKNKTVTTDILTQVIDFHFEEDKATPFQTEEYRLEWLLQRSSILALDYLKKQDEKRKNKISRNTIPVHS